MRHAVIMLYECNSKSKSDYLYVKKVTSKLYIEQNRHMHPIYTGAKTELYGDKAKKKICSILGSYSQPDDLIDIIWFADLDFPLNNNDDKDRNSKIMNFTSKFQKIKNVRTHIVWFNSDIEEVFLGTKVKKNEKKSKAEAFFADKKDINTSNLSDANPINNIKTSNLLLVLDDVFDKKSV